MLSSEIVKQVRQIQIRTGRQVADVMAGEYLSVFKGVGMEFDEVRPYVSGDDIRSIDWNVTARVGIPYVKRFVEERELTVILMVDISESLSFGSLERSKREAAGELSALLAFSAIQNSDKIGLILFNDGVRAFIPPRKGQKHALRIVREVLAHTEPQREDIAWWKLHRRFIAGFEAFKKRSKHQSRQTNIREALDFVQKIRKKKSVIFLISDFVDQDCVDALKRASSRHDVISVIVNDGREFEPVNAGLLTLEDAESGKSAEIDTASEAFRELCKNNALDRVEDVRKMHRSAGIDCIEIDARGSIVDPLLKFFKKRQSKIRR